MNYDAERDYQEREEHLRREKAARERAEWAELYHIYERCIGIAEKIWTAKLETAAAQQQALAEAMRNRLTARNGGLASAEIAVPLFTPRDRLQFVKEVGATLLISADRRNLTALYKDPNGETELAQAKEAVAGEGPVEAASGADETDQVVEGYELGEPISQAPAPSV